MRFKGHGGKGTPNNGDLIVIIHVISDKNFNVNNLDLYYNLEVDLYTAILGGHAEIETFENKLKIKIPSCTPNNKKFRIHGKGMPLMENPLQTGDLIINVQIIIPESISKEERILFEKLQKIKT